MSFVRGIAAALLRLIARARRFAPIALLYSVVPRSWKLGVTRGLLNSALGSDHFEIRRAIPPDGDDAAAPARQVQRIYSGQGVNLFGYVRGEFGLGESVRRVARALAQSGYPFELIDFELSTPGQAEDHSLDAWLSKMPTHATSIYFVNPDQMLLARAHLEEQRMAGRYVIGYWFWELERFPEAWSDAFQLVDEVWVASEFVRNSVAAATHKPVHLVPLPIECLPASAVDRDRFGLERDRFVFLFSFDYHSYPQRKNPEAVIAAFRMAFPPERDDVRLLIKTVHADRLPDAHLRLVNATAADPRIRIADAPLLRTDVSALLACADAYVSLHRSEGLGLGMAEAMALGKPVIATGYSGNMDFMSPQDACVVGFSLVDVPADAYPHWQNQRWADPDVAQAARYMHALADAPTGARELGCAAMARIRRQYAPFACASAMIARLQNIAAPPTG